MKGFILFMIDDVLVSIIVPVYNVENYIDDCIKSLVKQSYKNIEVLLIDDGSTDQSSNKCDSWGKEDSRIRVFHQNNAGLSAARNLGLKNMKGKYVTFVDSDDLVEPNMIKHLLEGIERYNADTCIGGYKRITDTKRILYVNAYEKKEYVDKEVTNELLPRLIGGLPDKHDSIKMAVWNVLFSRNLIVNNELKFVSEREIMSEDIIWDINYFVNSKKVCVVDTTEYLYRVRQGSLSIQIKYDTDRLQKIKKLYFLEKRLIKDNGIKGNAIIRLQKVFFINLTSCFVQDVKFYSGKPRKRKLLKIVNDNVVKQICNEYPIAQLKIKQKIFVMLIKYKRVNILALLFMLKENGNETNK